MSALVALDLGSTGVRALLLDESGEVRARAYRPLGSAFPAPGRVEQDPAEMWERSVEVLREVLVGVDDARALGVVTQRATVLAWDRSSGEPLAPALSWQDQRSAERVAGMRAAGIPITTLASATKLEWWLQNEPAVQEAARAGRLQVGTPDSWLSYRLTGGAAHVTDPGQASCTALFDPNAGAWAVPLCELFGVPPEVLPQLVASNAVIGETSRKLLGCALPVAARAGDQQAAAFGQGVHQRGAAKLTLGTSAMLDVHTGEQPAVPPAATFPLVLWQLEGRPPEFCLEAQVLTAGAAVDWLVSLGVAPDGAGVDRLAREVESSGGVQFVPALQGLGTPYGDDEARGLFSGLTRGTGRAHLARAVLDGVAQRCVDLTDALEPAGAELHADGGLARSGALLQTLADLYGRDVLRAAETETTALGAAQLAGLAVGVFESPAACRKSLAAPERFRPALPEAERREARARWARLLERARRPLSG